MITNEKNELISTKTVTGWRMCIDYRRLNQATRKDYFPLSFMDQMIKISWSRVLLFLGWLFRIQSNYRQPERS